MFIGVTDDRWFAYLRKLQPDEVNFWFPSTGLGFRALQPGEPFLFKLHSPNNFVVGGGYFVRYSALPLSIAWEAFGDKNGAPDFDTCYRRIAHYKRGKLEPDPLIGCVVLTTPFFFDDKDWIPAPSDWSGSIVRGKTYDIQNGIGESVWLQIQERLTQNQQPVVPALTSASLVHETPDGPRFGQPYITRPRLGQGGFRVIVTEAYQRRCAITGEKTLPVLTAAHIKPYHQSGPHDVQNGILLRSDLHLLFDRGLITINNDLNVEVSSRIRAEYGNGRQYYALHGQKLAILPSNTVERPSDEFLAWHKQNVYSE